MAVQIVIVKPNEWKKGKHPQKDLFGLQANRLLDLMHVGEDVAM